MSGFRVTYEIVTPESAGDGEVDEIGFVLPGEWKIPIAQAMSDPEESLAMDLRNAMRLCYPSEDSGRWFCEDGAREDYRTGARENRALHPPENITRASYARLRRLFRIRV